MAEPTIFHHAILTKPHNGGSMAGLAFERRGRWLLLPAEEGRVYLVQPGDRLELLEELAPTVAHIAQADVDARGEGTL